MGSLAEWESILAAESKAMKKELKPIVKKLNLPGGRNASFDRKGYSWAGGRGGIKAQRKVFDAIAFTDTGFKKLDAELHDSPDGSACSNSNYYSNGKYILRTFTYHGSDGSYVSLDVTIKK